MAPLTVDSEVEITRWPDVRTIAGRADDMRVCALLTHRSCTVSECAESLEVDPREVQAIFNAAYLAGYALVDNPDDRATLRESSSLTSPLVRFWKGVRHRLVAGEALASAERI